MAAIKRKKMHQNHLTSTQSQIATLEQQMHAVETANLNVETLKVMQSANQAMKVIHGGMNVDKIDETMYVKYPSLPSLFASRTPHARSRGDSHRRQVGSTLFLGGAQVDLCACPFGAVWACSFCLPLIVFPV